MHKLSISRVLSGSTFLGILLSLTLPAPGQNLPLAPDAPRDVHLEIRLAEPRSTYKLGERIVLEYTCYSEHPDVYISNCGGEDTNVRIMTKPLDAHAITSAEPIETAWIQRTYCANGQYMIDDIAFTPKLPPMPQRPNWARLPLDRIQLQPYPMSAGRFQLIATSSAWLAREPMRMPFTLTSQPLEIQIVDDSEWRAKRFAEAKAMLSKLEPLSPAAEFNKAYAMVENFPDLDVLEWLISGEYAFVAESHPDRVAAARLMRKHLSETIVFSSSTFKEEFLATLALQLAGENPELYNRAVKFQQALGEPSLRDLSELRAWVEPHYTLLLNEVGESMVANRRNSELMEHYDVEDKAEDLLNANVVSCDKNRYVLGNSTLRRLMRRAGISESFIREHLAEMRQ